MRKSNVFPFVPVSVFLLLAALVFSWNSDVRGPMIQADESSYLLNASAIAGYENSFSSSYHSGYSLLIAPAFMLGESPEEVWRGVVFANALMYFTGVLLLFVLAKSLTKGNAQLLAIFSVVAVACYPMWVVMVGYSFSQISFFLVYSLLALLAYRSFNGGAWWWVLCGLVAGYLYWIHPTGIAVCISLAMMSLYESVRKRNFRPAAGAIIAIVTMLMVYQYLFSPWLLERMSIGGAPAKGHYPSLRDALASLLNVSSLLEFIVRFGGHVLYLTMGTLGLVWASLFTRSKRQKNETVQVSPVFVGFLYLSLLGTTSLSVLLFTFADGANRLDHFIYGRYVEGVLAPLLLIGALMFTVRTLFISIIIAFVSAVLLSLGMDEFSHTARMNVSAFWQDYWLRDKGAMVWGLSGIVLIGVVLLLRKVGHLVALLFVIAFFGWLSSKHIDWHIRAAAAETKRLELAEKVRDSVSEGTCVAFDPSGINSTSKHVFWFDFGFMLYDYPLQMMSVSRWKEHCNGPIFSYRDNLDETHGLYLAANADNKGPMLWTKEPLKFHGRYPFIVERRSAGLGEILLNGWHDVEAKHVWSSNSAELALPVPEECDEGECSAEITFSVFNSSDSNPVEVSLETEEIASGSSLLVTSTSSVDHKVQINLPYDKDLVTVVLRVSEAVSPESLGLSTDSRVLGVALKSVVLTRKQ